MRTSACTQMKKAQLDSRGPSRGLCRGGGRGLTYVHGGVGDVHEQHQRAAGNGKALLPAALVVHVDIDMEGGF